jgi:hypothetical protein
MIGIIPGLCAGQQSGLALRLTHRLQAQLVLRQTESFQGGL